MSKPEAHGTKVQNTPSDVENDSGVVLVSGPDGVAVSMTPEAAVVTGSRLIENAAQARGKADIDAGGTAHGHRDRRRDG